MRMFKEWMKDNKRFFVTLTVLVLIIAVVNGVTPKDDLLLVTYEDPDQVVQIQEEETPMADTKVQTKTSRKSTKKNVKLAKASKKTYNKNLPTKTKKTVKTQKTTSSLRVVTVKTDTTVKTLVKEAYKKKSKYKTVTTTVETTIKTTTTTTNKPKVASNTNSSTSAATSAYTNNSIKNGVYQIETVAPKATQSLIDAYHIMHFDVEVKSSVSYAGKYDTKEQRITLKRVDETVYHELGHFLAFMAGNADLQPDFQAIYSAEKDKYVGAEKVYAKQNSKEYFAESYMDYIINPSYMKSTRPKTYAAIVAAIDKVDQARAERYYSLYKSHFTK